MATIGFYNSSSIQSLFSGLNSSNSASSLDLTTYNSIKNGSYGKLMKQYYSNNPVKESSTDKSDKKSDASEKTNATRSRDNAAAVIDDQKALRSNDLWKQTTKTDADGKRTSEYDTDKIYKAVSSFVKDYNSLISSAGDSDNKTVLNSASTMVNYTKANASLLKSVGITVGSDNKLSLDEGTFKASDMTTAKSIFTGAGSYAQSVSANASSIYSGSVSQLSELATKNSYSSDGRYSYVSGATYNQFT